MYSPPSPPGVQRAEGEAEDEEWRSPGVAAAKVLSSVDDCILVQSFHHQRWRRFLAVAAAATSGAALSLRPSGAARSPLLSPNRSVVIVVAPWAPPTSVATRTTLPPNDPAAAPCRRVRFRTQAAVIAHSAGRALPLCCAIGGRRASCRVAAAAAVAVTSAASAPALAIDEAAALPGHPPAVDVAGEARQAEAAAKPAVIPCPSPPPGPTVGRFHTLPALQCRLHPTAPGGASPDPNAVPNPDGLGGMGWELRTNRTTGAVVTPFGAGTCASPVNDGFQLAYMAAPEEMRGVWGPVTITNLFPGGVAGAEFDRVGNVFYAQMGAQAASGPILDGHLVSEYFAPTPVRRLTGVRGWFVRKRL